MFEAVRSNKRVAQVILAILIVPFAFFGMDAYFSDAPGGNEVATVAGFNDRYGELEEALRDQQDRLRAAAGGTADRALLEFEELRRSVLENLIQSPRAGALCGREPLCRRPQELQTDDRQRGVLPGRPAVSRCSATRRCCVPRG